MKIIDKLTLWLVRKNIRRNRKLRKEINKELITYFQTEYTEDAPITCLYAASAELFWAAKEVPSLSILTTGDKYITMLESGINAELFDALNHKTIHVV